MSVSNMHTQNTADNCSRATPQTMKKLLSSSNISSHLSILDAAVSRSNNHPSGSDLLFLRAISPTLHSQNKDASRRLLSAIRQISSQYNVSLKKPSNDESSDSDSSDSLTPRPSAFEETNEATDEALHLFNVALDAARGIQNAAPSSGGALCPQDVVKVGLVSESSRNAPVCVEMKKPQLNFPDYPIDNSDAPFVPPYQMASSASEPISSSPSKPNTVVQSYLQDLYKANSRTGSKTRHPFEDQISSAVETMKKQPFNSDEIIKYSSNSDTPFSFITTEEALFDSVKRLKNATEIAIDLENHSIRTFQGFTCLIQLSTRREDFVIDTLLLRGSVHRALAPIFADASIVKVLHGANKDVEWLERDFGIYVVNMFDTGQASRLLQYKSYSLAHLLGRFCSVHPTKAAQKKKFQLSDWRIRPLPADMLSYARDDTHYLLYIYDCLRDELTSAKLLATAWERSGAICRRRHHKVRYNPGMARQLAAQHGLGFDPVQMRLLDALCKWRDVTAREEDESLLYVSPIPVLVGIAHAREKGKTVEGLMEHGFPLGPPPPIVHNHREKIVQLVWDALDAKGNEKSPVKANGGTLGTAKVKQDAPENGPDNIQKNEKKQDKSGLVVKEQVPDSDSGSDGEDENTADGSIADKGLSVITVPVSNETETIPSTASAVADHGRKEESKISGEEPESKGESIHLESPESHQEPMSADVGKALSSIPSSGAESTPTSTAPADNTKPKPPKESGGKDQPDGLGRKDGKRKREADTSQAEEEVMEFFDYRKAKKEALMTEVKQVEQFDPLHKLKKDWREDKTRVRKRRKGTGKSLSYKTNLSK